MELLKFKTNLTNQADISKVAELLEKEASISQWEIDPDSPENILSVSGTDLNPQKVENAVRSAGFSAELLRVLGLGGAGL